MSPGASGGRARRRTPRRPRGAPDGRRRASPRRHDASARRRGAPSRRPDVRLGIPVGDLGVVMSGVRGGAVVRRRSRRDSSRWCRSRLPLPADGRSRPGAYRGSRARSWCRSDDEPVCLPGWLPWPGAPDRCCCGEPWPCCPEPCAAPAGFWVSIGLLALLGGLAPASAGFAALWSGFPGTEVCTEGVTGVCGPPAAPGVPAAGFRLGLVVGLVVVQVQRVGQRRAGQRRQHLAHVGQLGVDAVAALGGGRQLALGLGADPVGGRLRLGDDVVGLALRLLEDALGLAVGVGPQLLGLQPELLGRAARRR